MAFDQYVVISPDEGSSVTFNGVRYTELETWGEYRVSPILIGGVGAGGATVIRVPYHPALVSSFRPQNREFVNAWTRLVVNGTRYAIESMQIIENRWIDIECGSGNVISQGG